MGSGEDDSEDVGVRRRQAISPASVSVVNTPLSPSQRPLSASLTASATLLIDGCPRNLKGFSRLAFDLPPNPSIDHLVPVILLECDGYLGEDGAQATTEIIV